MDQPIIQSITKLNNLKSQLLENDDTNYEQFCQIVSEMDRERNHFYYISNNIQRDMIETVDTMKKKYSAEIAKRGNEIIGRINELVKTYHNPELIEPDEQPNGNTIYKIYDDFEITSEKGGSAYGRRSVFTYKNQLFYKPYQVRGINPFPIQNGGNRYAIMTVEHCLEVYELMREYRKIQ